TGPFPITADVPVTPRGWYAACKVFTEAAGRVYAESHAMSVLAVRLGWCPRDASHVEELRRTDWGPDVYLSPGDAGPFFACAIELPLRGCLRPQQVRPSGGIRSQARTRIAWL